MVKVEFSLSEDKKSLILNIKGHAGQAEIGRDIVCAASSMLAYTLAQDVADMQKASKLFKKPSLKLGVGDASIVCKPLKAYYDEALHSYTVILKGYRLLAKNYPQYVELKEFGKALEP